MTQPRHTKRSIDDLINNTPEAQPINYAKPPVETPKNDAAEPKAEENTPKTDPEFNTDAEIEPEIREKPAEIAPEPPENQEIEPKVVEKTATPVAEVDEYGSPVAKQKTYTEEQVQAMIRDRLKRGAFKQEQQQATPQQIQQAEESGFQYNENSEMSWSQQLKQFVKSTMQEVKNEEFSEQRERARKHAEVEFESKFHSGMARHPDFVQVMADKHITDDMVHATRGLSNPAGFLYAAAKRMPQELDRISKIQDPYQQVSEMGRLHERLAKPKPSSNAPRPLSQDRGDITDKAPAKVSIDHLIAEHAKSRYGR